MDNNELFKLAQEENRKAWEKAYEAIPAFETPICPIRFKLPDYQYGECSCRGERNTFFYSQAGYG